MNKNNLNWQGAAKEKGKQTTRKNWTNKQAKKQANQTLASQAFKHWSSCLKSYKTWVYSLRMQV